MLLVGTGAHASDFERNKGVSALRATIVSEEVSVLVTQQGAVVARFPVRWLCGIAGIAGSGDRMNRERRWGCIKNIFICAYIPTSQTAEVSAAGLSSRSVFP